MKWLILSLLALLGSVVVACSAGDAPVGSPSLTPSATPTRAPKATGSPETFSVTSSPSPFIDHSVRACTSGDLIGQFAGPVALTGGQLTGGLAFANRSGTPCRLEGRPALDLLDASGTASVLARTEFCSGTSCLVQSVILSPNITQIQLHAPTPGIASLALYWPTYGLQGPPCNPPAPRVTLFRVTLPEVGGTIDVPVTGVADIEPCGQLGLGVFVGTPATIWPADSDTPAAGVCADAPPGPIAHFDIDVDVPAPRCSMVRSEQVLEVTNKTNQVVGVQLGDTYEALTPGTTSTLFTASFGSYLAPGVHIVHTSYFHGSGPEIVMPPATTP